MTLKDLLIYFTAILVGLGLWKVSGDLLYYAILVKRKDSIRDKGTASAVIDFLALFLGIGGVFAWSLLWL